MILADEKKRWKRIGQAIGKTDVGCHKVAKEMGLSK
jgi:hypothetical protein